MDAHEEKIGSSLVSQKPTMGIPPGQKREHLQVEGMGKIEDMT
jgi:hypothetical protein